VEVTITISNFCVP